MKITVLLLLMSIAGVYAVDSYAQSTKLTLQLSDKSIEEILFQVEEQSEFRFFYNENVNVGNKVSLNVKNKTVFEVLDEILRETNIVSRIGRQIACTTRKKNDMEYCPANQCAVTVTSANGEPLPGVSVVIKGTTTVPLPT
jgi:hypothetical protein